MEDVLAAQRRYFDSGATWPPVPPEMLTRLELASPGGRGAAGALKADLNKSPYAGVYERAGPHLAERALCPRASEKWARPSGSLPPVPVPLHGHCVPGALRRV